MEQDGSSSFAAAAAAGHGSAGGSDASLRAQVAALQAQLAAALQQQPAPQASASSSNAAADAAIAAAGAVDPGMAMFATLFRGMQDGQAQQVAAMQQMAAQQAKAATAALVLKSLGDLPTFSAKGQDTTLDAHDWLQRAEDFYAAREGVLGITAAQGEQSRLLEAASALAGDARTWFTNLPLRPTTWALFVVAVKDRFCMVPATRIRLDRLQAMVKKSTPGRDKYTLSGLQTFTTAFTQLAGQIPDTYYTLNSKLALLAQGLPERAAEQVMREEAKTPPTPLHLVISEVLSRAAFKDHVSSAHSSSSASAAPIMLDAVSAAMDAFGCSREAAAGVYMRDEEGWKQHDTSGAQSRGTGSSSTPASSPASFSQAQVDQLLLNALGRVGAGPAAREHQKKSSRSVPGGIRAEVGPVLSKAREAAVLCIKCGVHKYEPGSRGHNSVTCKAAIDKTTTVEEGKKKADFR